MYCFVIEAFTYNADHARHHVSHTQQKTLVEERQKCTLCSFPEKRSVKVFGRAHIIKSPSVRPVCQTRESRL